MPDSAATLLALALVGVYLFDSTLFLAVGEAVISSRGQALRRVDFGAAFELGGRRPYVPNPFTPFRPVFRLDWDFSGSAVSEAAQTGDLFRARLHSLRWIRAASTLCAVLIVIVAPAALVLKQEPLFLAAALGCVTIAIAASAVLWVQRKELGLSIAQAGSLCFVAIVCLPCSANLARAIAAQRMWTLAASDLPLLGFADADLPSIRSGIHAALSNAKRFIPEDGPQLAVIDAQLRKLEGHGA